MSVSQDYLDLNKSSLFKHVRECVDEGPTLNKTQNLVEVIDDLLLFWNVKELCLHVTNWRAVKSQTVSSKFQSLIPTTPHNFYIDKIVANNDGSCVALSGPKGVSVFELPRRWGPHGLFMEGKDRITCQTTILSESFFLNNAHLEVLQIRWHPSSSKCHLLVLLSDNTVRVYEDSELKHIWRVGPVLNQTPSSNQQEDSTLPTLSNLGEQVIDFDIIPIHASQKKNNNNNLKFQWHVILLQGNGNLFLLNANLESMKPRLLGPLIMAPQNFSNYGLESCSIMVIASDPPAIVVAETTGKLHHMLLLESDTVDESFNELDSSFVVFPTSWKLKVLETVELELGISDTKDINCPIHMKRDYINTHRYYVYHNTGLHAVTMNFIGELQNYIEGKIPQVFLSKPSQAEYIVCSKLDNSKKINPIIGLGLHQHPPGLISCMASGEVISLKIIVDSNLLAIIEKATVKENHTQSMMKENFTTHIQNMLQRKVSQPIFSLDRNSTIRPQKAYEILSQSINVLNEHYIQKQQQVVREILKRIDLQNKVKEQQLSEIRNLEAEREIISLKAHQLAEKFDECSDKQVVLTKRCQNLLGMGNVSLPNNIIAEEEFTNKVNQIHNTTKEFFKAIERLKENMNKQNYHISKYTNSNSTKTVELPEKQERVLKEILLTITNEIENQIDVLKKVKKIVH